ncbi:MULTISPECIES: hypothetical protein [unclassified Rhizobium]|uniref:hypothetical protein n=1 Tax=unclassified Rhizobium TaxID=2613769 RepID=UPI0016205DCD|nr:MULTISPECIES: hypothetical protein [unclassified Rhizobium]MBB3545172.1 hypothetical protein [Rhizobium sp. BK399]MCS3743585.1 hypothetical protein [Rhizobium sp. BK661]MCS4096528.1 hypothetical protein [Rhizobium sp. BK176]
MVIRGAGASVVNGGGSLRAIEINHSFIELHDFVVDGHFTAAETEGSYRDKLIYMMCNTPGPALSGLRLI